MLQTQVNYWANVENKRHNLQSEALTKFYNSEVAKHNRQSEKQLRNELKETRRHNKSTEKVARGNLKELKRHNVKTEDVAYGNLSELTRHNLASEANEHIKALASQTSAGASVMNAQASQVQAAAATKQAGAAAANATTNMKVGMSQYELNEAKKNTQDEVTSKTRAEAGVAQKDLEWYDLTLPSKLFQNIKLFK